MMIDKTVVGAYSGQHVYGGHLWKATVKRAALHCSLQCLP